jgi:site-specific recombinase XerD
MRRAFKTVFYMRGNFVNKEGKSPIVLRITLDGDRVTIGTTGITITPSLWDIKKQRLKGKTTEALQVNKKLDNIESEIQEISDKLEYEGKLSLEKVKAIYLNTEDDSNTIGALFDKYLSSIKDQVAVRHLSTTTLQKYMLCQVRFMAMLNDKFHCKDMLLKDVTPAVIQDFSVYLMTVVRQCNNTAMKTMKTLKTVILYGIKLGVIHSNPYLGVKLHLEPVDRGFLTEEELQSIIKKDFEIDRLGFVRDLFVFSCFTGLSYIDVKKLKADNIVTLNGIEWIKMAREKTSTPVSVVLFDGAKCIIKKYENDPKRKDKLFPSMSNQKMNQYLKEIATSCGIKKNITFHMARHTFATLTLSKGVPIESVSRMLGHTNIKTTQIYAKITNKKIEEDMTKFFNDKTIRNLGIDSANMTGMDKNEEEDPVEK